MATRLLLHIGTQKSGTTYLQRVLQNLSADLAEQGVLYPVWQHDGRAVYNHEPATYGFLGRENYPWVPDTVARKQQGQWDFLVSRIRSWHGPAVVSAEAISVIDSRAAESLVKAFDVSEVEVIITARDLGRVLPSSWQQNVRNGRAASFATYLRNLARQRGEGSARDLAASWESDPANTFWRAYALGGLASRWADIVGAQAVCVVAVPRRGAPTHALWERFRQALQLEGALPDTPPEISLLQANVGLTEPEVRFLAAFNAAAHQAGMSDRDARALRLRLITEALITRPDRGPAVELPADWHQRVHDWARDDVDVLLQSGAAVIGDETDLLVTGGAIAGTCDPDAVAAAAAAALMHCIVAAPTERRD